MTEVIREIRRLTFDDKAEIDEIHDSRIDGLFGGDGEGRSNFFKLKRHWSLPQFFNPHNTGFEHFGMFENSQLNYIRCNRYFRCHPRHLIYRERNPKPIIPFSSSFTLSRKTKNVPSRIGNDGKTNLNLIELQNYAMINGSERFGCNVIVTFNPGHPELNKSIDVGEGKIWHFDSHYNDEEIQSRRYTHYHCMLLEEILPEEQSKHEWIRDIVIRSTRAHKMNIFMFVRHNFES